MREKAVCYPERMNFARVLARAVVAGGGLFWVVAAFAGPYAFQGVPLAEAAWTASLPLALTAAVLAVGWWHEQVAAVLLFAIAGAGVVWGLFAGWEPSVWLLVSAVFVVPMMLAGSLFRLASRIERACGGSDEAMAMLSRRK